MDIFFTSLILLYVVNFSIAEDGCDPTIDAAAANVTVAIGETAILPCSIENLGDYRVVWVDRWSSLLTLDERRIVDDPRISIERPTNNDWNLRISETNYTDQGQYQCLINTNPVTSKSVMLTVLEEN